MIKHTVDEEIKRNMEVCGGRVWQIFYKPDYWMNSDYVGYNQKLTFPMWVNYIERVYKCQFIQLFREYPDSKACLFRYTGERDCGDVEGKWLYRLEATDPSNGLWYNADNQYVWGCKNCKGEAKNLPMGEDEKYHIDRLNWYSSCSNVEDLLHWYSKEDATYLLKHGFRFTKYYARDYHEFDLETVFLKETATMPIEIDFLSLFEEKKNG